jgi:hypothetical protein
LASSPYAKTAVLWETYCKQYGPTGDALTLVAHGASKVFNLTLPQRVIDRALKKDRAKATAECLAEFRTELEGFVTLRAGVRRGGPNFQIEESRRLWPDRRNRAGGRGISLRGSAFIEVDENALTELLYCRQPISMLRDRRATHGRLDVSSMA